MIPDKFTALFEKLQSKLEMDPPDVAGAQRIKNEDVKWSKGPSFSILPYGLELAGVTPSPILGNEPKSKKNCFKFYCNEAGEIYRSDIYGVSSTIIETEICQVEGQLRSSVRFDDDGKAVRASGVVFESGKPYISCRLEDDGEYWCYEYKCEGQQVASMIVYASNSVPGTEIFVERDGEVLIGLYFSSKESKIYVYRV
ncbi:hypothetical protein [Pseudomonas sp. MN1F]|uniref:hypothetical protein n=1 Tax=Pseudomonas sp. MN1F TaxID=1366632 RepID=UPI00128F83AD|nr:hypothetical protein [Pseudomonas sp. MN1F]MQG94609.1 hypothetical protein [Pseudomonas sp. MN1F]